MEFVLPRLRASDGLKGSACFLLITPLNRGPLFSGEWKNDKNYQRNSGGTLRQKENKNAFVLAGRGLSQFPCIYITYMYVYMYVYIHTLNTNLETLLGHIY